MDGSSLSQNVIQTPCISGFGGSNRYLLPQIRHADMHKKCLVIDLDETLVHSSFKVNIFREYTHKLPRSACIDFYIAFLLKKKDRYKAHDRFLKSQLVNEP